MPELKQAHQEAIEGGTQENLQGQRHTLSKLKVTGKEACAQW